MFGKLKSRFSSNFKIQKIDEGDAYYMWHTIGIQTGWMT